MRVNVDLPPASPTATVNSPCIRMCTLDDDQVCIGCGRHLDEIVAWTRLSVAAQQEVLQRSAERLAKRHSHQQV